MDVWYLVSAGAAFGSMKVLELCSPRVLATCARHVYVRSSSRFAFRRWQVGTLCVFFLSALDIVQNLHQIMSG